MEDATSSNAKPILTEAQKLEIAAALCRLAANGEQIDRLGPVRRALVKEIVALNGLDPAA